MGSVCVLSWPNGKGVGHINDVTLHWARLVLRIGDR